MIVASDSYFCALGDTALIAFSGEDAVSFLHAQLTSDVASLGLTRTQYSGYCSPKGRLLATCLLWPQDGAVLMLLPTALREAIQARLTKYVLRARVKITDATRDYALFGLAGEAVSPRVSSLVGGRVVPLHEVAAADDWSVTHLPLERYLLIAPRAKEAATRDALLALAEERDESAWAALDVAAGVPVITPESQEEYVPQMVNLDLVGGVSYSKGCYPGQEIVARTHYLGKLKQRMYRVRVTGEVARVGDPVYSAAFGADQASGAILYAGQPEPGGEALVVVQKTAVDTGEVHLRSLDGPLLEILPLPYPLPA